MTARVCYGLRDAMFQPNIKFMPQSYVYLCIKDLPRELISCGRDTKCTLVPIQDWTNAVYKFEFIKHGLTHQDYTEVALHYFNVTLHNEISHLHAHENKSLILTETIPNNIKFNK